MFVMSYRDYKKAVQSNAFSEERIEKVEKYIKIKTINFVLFIVLAVLIFEF